jgi:tetratricopeptide (TPR) repeat protein
VTCGVFNKEATRILTSDDSGAAQLWDMATGKPDGAPFTHTGAVNWVDFHPDDKRLVTASGPNAQVWSVTDRKKPLATIAHQGKAKSVIKSARFSPDGKWLVTGSTDGTAQVWDAATYQSMGVKIDRQFPVLCVRFSPDGSRLVVAGEDGQAAVYDTVNWKPVGVPVLAPGPVFSAAMTDDNQFMVISSLLLDSVQYYEISTGRAIGQGLVIPTQATCVDYHVQDRVVVVACDDGTVRALGVPFVNEDVPGWVGGFAERIVGLKKTGPETFERVDAHLEQLRAYAPRDAVGSNRDFPKLVQWKMTIGPERHGFPRFTSTVAMNVERRVEERSADALFECFEAVAANALIEGAMSLYLPNRRQGEFIADFVLHDPDADPLARCYAAGTLVQCGRSQEAMTVVEKALKDAPADARVVRRAAKIQARLQNKDLAIELFEKALKLDPASTETMRSYAWALYNFNQPEKAAQQFRRVQELVGQMNDDLVAGLCLCAAAQKKENEAKDAYRRLVAIDPAWRDPAHLAGLRGWMQGELVVLERVRRTVFPGK